MDVMDKLVKRVTVVQGSGEHRRSTVVFESDEDTDDEHERRSFGSLERAVRHMLKAELIRAQEAYSRHVKSASRGGSDWLIDGPSNILRAQRKGLKEVRKVASLVYDDEDEEKED
jgi:hypothetical protein